MSTPLKVVPTPSLTLPANLEFLRPIPQFVLAVIVPKPEQPGKTNKFPMSPATLAFPVSKKDPANWLTCEAAYTRANELNSAGGLNGHPVGVGFYISADLNIWCLDIDGGLDAKNQWFPAVNELFGKLPGAAWEFSHSGRGLHAWGRCSQPVAPHETQHKEDARHLHLELYSRLKFMLLGTMCAGAAIVTPALPDELRSLFPALGENDAAAVNAEWTDEPDPSWHGPDDDNTLLTIALKSKSKLATLYPNLGKATLKQLWEADVDALARQFPSTNGEAYDASRADQAIACHWAFWTGNNWERIATLMRRSALYRHKHDNDDYMQRTIGKACAWQKTFYNDGRGVAPGAEIPASAVSDTCISVDDFYAYLPKHEFIFVPTRELWSAAGVDGTLPWVNGNKPTMWLDQARPIHQMTWAPGKPLVISDTLVDNGGWVPKKGANTFNLYRPPLPLTGGDPAQAKPWIDLVHYVYPDDAEHMIKCFAHRRQRPAEKLNHAIVMGGMPGIGKDTILEPVKHCVGPWNFTEIKPGDLLGEFDGWKKSVMLRVSEARDMGDITRHALYEHTKTLLVTPPDVLRCNEKYLREHAVFNVIGVVITTNHKDGLYLPADDRRHYVAWSDRDQYRDYQKEYWRQMYAWYHGGGFAHVIAYLDSIDLTGFDPKAPPPRTPAFWIMVNAGRPAEDSTLADILDALGNPQAVTVDVVHVQASKKHPEFCSWLRDSRNSRSIPVRFAAAEYVPVLNMDTKDKLWKVAGKRVSIYVRQELGEQARIAAANALSRPAK